MLFCIDETEDDFDGGKGELGIASNRSSEERRSNERFR